MKTVILSLFFATSLFFSPNKVTSKTKNHIDSEILIAVFESYTDGEYIFSYTNDEDEDETFIFNKVTKEVLEKFDFKNDESLIGEKFELTFEVQSSDNEDEDDVNVIIDAKQL